MSDSIAEIKTDTLEMQRFASSVCNLYGYRESRIHYEYEIESRLYKLHIIQQIPSKVLQDNELIARYPANGLQYLKKYIPFMKPKYKEIRVNEVVTFPNYKPPISGEKIYFRTYENINWKGKNSENDD